MLRSLLLAGAALATPSLACAQGTDATAQDAAPPHAARAGPPGDLHAEEDNEIVVTGFQRARGDLLSGTSVVSGDELTRDLRPSLGETLQHLPGVSATSFGPNASRPVLRGFQGDRVRVLTDGIGSLDVSSSSADHAVAINPLIADRIEVLRGPSALLFGSSAIGGVVNVIASRIPRRVPEEMVHADGLLAYGSAANERSSRSRRRFRSIRTARRSQLFSRRVKTSKAASPTRPGRRSSGTNASRCARATTRMPNACRWVFCNFISSPNPA